jgi:pimeloyl-ACP methyl ester carboxylesterase
LDRYRHADLVSDLFAMLDHAGLRQAYPLGVSFGSTVALAALHAQPDRFPRGLLQGGFAYRPLAWAEVLLASMARWWPGSLDHLPLRRFLFKQALEPSFDHREPDIWRYYLDHDGSQPIAAVARRALWLHHADLRPLLPGIRQPIFLICGDRDPLVGHACEQDLLRGLPNVTQAEIEQCGHMPHYTHPEVLSEVVRRFLAPLAA